ncbi:MAG: tRNA pseudouridine(55) synthase TruB [Deltaproteobacteria bacterium]|nr:tRNA pseudouridine(55) synthase TruB [Deltaproteobacteria bacterium]
MSEKIYEIPPDGILLIDKEKGRSSFDSVRMVRRILKCKKTGHAGTLDPFATGLLILLLGQGTKLSPYIMGGRKKYRAEIRLGIETDTYDSTGLVTKEMPLPELGAESIHKEIAGFTGVIEQVPPAFSALKVNGERAYKLARRGINVELKKREVTVYSIDVMDIKLPLITVDVICSAGTYIRSLALDIGKRLGTVAHLQDLRRISSGQFNVDDAIVLKNPDSIDKKGLLERVIPLERALPEMITVSIDNHLAKRIRNGYRPLWNELDLNNKLSSVEQGNIKLMAGSDFVAMLEIETAMINSDRWLKKIKVFN